MKAYSLTLLFLFTLVGGLSAQTSFEDIRKNGVTNEVTESFKIGAGTTLDILNLGSLAFATGYVWNIDGTVVSVTGVELNHLVGVSSNIQTQLNTKQDVTTILTEFLSLVPAADRLPYFDSPTTMDTTAFTPLARSLLDDVSSPDMLDTLGVHAFIQTMLNDPDAATARGTIGALGTSGTNTNSGEFVNTNTTNATTSDGTTGAIRTLGGMSVAQNSRVGGALIVVGNISAGPQIGATDLFATDDVQAFDDVIANDDVVAAGSVIGAEIIGDLAQDGYIHGLRMVTNATDPANDIDVLTGLASSAGSFNSQSGFAVLPTPAVIKSMHWTGFSPAANTDRSLTKRIDVNWVQGNNNGMLDNGSIANGTYHIHVIKNPATPRSDILASLSHDDVEYVSITIATPAVVTWGTTGNGHGLVAGSSVRFYNDGTLPTGILEDTDYWVIAAGLTETQFQISTVLGGAAVNTSGSITQTTYCQARPILPTGYTHFRRIGSIVRVGGSNLAFRQVGDKFFLSTPTLDLDTTAVTTARTTATLSVPKGIVVDAMVRCLASNAAAGVLVNIGPTLDADVAPSITAVPGTTLRTQVAASVVHGGPEQITTDTLGQVYARSSAATTTVRIFTLGWIDNRGQIR